MNTKNGIRFSTVLALIFIICSPVFGQDNAGIMQSAPSTQQPTGNYYSFDKGSNVLGLGIGMGGYYDYWGDGYSQTPNLVLTYENGTFGNVGPGTISLGGLFAYKGETYNWMGNDGYNYSEKWNYWILGFRSAYHLKISAAPLFDPYAGLMLGYYFLGYSFSTNNPNYMHPGDPGYVYYSKTYPNYYALSIYLGARYFISNNVGIWGELGYGYSTLAIGINFRI
ncbi:MAG TPA: hypothetical protein VK806_10895 [Bacteroidia bacterium]|nr:hypothetical protein [Bacteroidia bacterium]